jgi:hypothetical protein
MYLFYKEKRPKDLEKAKKKDFFTSKNAFSKQKITKD